MKILLLTDKMDIGGAETHIATLARGLREAGNEITLISAGGVYLKDLLRQGIRCIIAPADKRTPTAIKETARLIGEEMKKCHVVHAHTRFTSFMARRVRGKRKFPPIVTTAHLNFKLFPFGPIAFWGDETLAVSSDIARYIRKNYRHRAKRITVTKNAIDTSSFLTSQNKKPLIIHTSRIDTGRAVAAFMLVDIAPLILEKNNGWRIVIVGDGNKFSELSARAQRVNESLGYEGVILTGARCDIPSILQHGSIFVGVSRSALEGMASGMPTVICGDEGYAGIVTEEKLQPLTDTNFCARGMSKANKSALLGDITRLMENPELRERLGTLSRKTVENLYNVKSMTSDAYNSYLRVVKKPSVCLAGFFGYGNMGDEESLDAAIIALKERGISEISVLTAKHADDRVKKFGVKCFDRMNLSEVRECICSSDILIFCGGNLLQNKTSTRSLLYYGSLLDYAFRRGADIYMLSSGFGEISGALGNALLKKSIERARFCGCRTSYDLSLAQKFNSNSRFMPDLCFLLPPSYSKKDKGSFAWIISSEQKITPEEIELLAQKRGLSPIAVILYKDKDISAAEGLSHLDIKCLIPKNRDELSQILSRCAFSISERLHGAILSLLSYTPSYLCCESTKCSALADEIKNRYKTDSMLIKYTPDAVAEKKEIGAKSSDFDYVLSDLKGLVKNAFEFLF